jgi:hypothetical protein
MLAVWGTFYIPSFKGFMYLRCATPLGPVHLSSDHPLGPLAPLQRWITSIPNHDSGLEECLYYEHDSAIEHDNDGAGGGGCFGTRTCAYRSDVIFVP